MKYLFETIYDLAVDPFTRFYLFLRQCPVYVRHPSLLLLDSVSYLFRIVLLTPQLFFNDSQENTYGETSYIALRYLIKEYSLSSKDRLCDCGSGFGKTVIYTQHCHGIPSVGIEKNRLYFWISSLFVRVMFLSNISLHHKNFCHYLPVASVYIFPGTCLFPHTRHMFLSFIKRMPQGTLIFSISAPLESSRLKKINHHLLSFSWGKAIVYAYRVCDTL